MTNLRYFSRLNLIFSSGQSVSFVRDKNDSIGIEPIGNFLVIRDTDGKNFYYPAQALEQVEAIPEGHKELEVTGQIPHERPTEI